MASVKVKFRPSTIEGKTGALYFQVILKSATPFPKCYLHKEKWTFDS